MWSFLQKAFVFWLLLDLSECILFKKESVGTSQWTPYATVNEVKSTLVCASLCSQDGNCKWSRYQKDDLTCQLASDAVGCFGRINDVQINVLRYYASWPGGTQQGALVETAVSSVEDKAHWDLLASSLWTEPTKHGYRFAIDGIRHDYETFATFNAPNPWLRIDLGQKYWIKGARVSVRPNTLSRFKFMEMRVGKDDIIGMPETETLCKNQLCYMIGNTDVIDLSFDCLNIIPGHIVTLQKLRHASDSFLDFNEIDLQVYCGAYKPTDVTTCVIEEENFVDYCQLRNTHVTGSTYLADKAGDKSSWQLRSSSLLTNTNLNAIKDGNNIGTIPNPSSIFASVPVSAGGGDTYPWVQVDMGAQKVVKSVQFYSYSDSQIGKHILYTEVRVGDIDVSDITPLGHRICANTVCKNTGVGKAVAAQIDDCSAGPIKGRYVTLQRYGVEPSGGYTALRLAEINIEFYVP